MIYANYECAQKSSPNGIKNRKRKEQWEEQAGNAIKIKQNKTNEQEHANNVTEEWLSYKAKLGKARTQIYPRRKEKPARRNQNG